MVRACRPALTKRLIQDNLNAQDSNRRIWVSLGANAFIRKPTEPDIFVQMLCEVFEKAESHTLAPAKAAPLEPSLYLTEYNKRVVAKLEDKVAELKMEITGRKKVEEALKQSFEKLQRVFKQAIGTLASAVEKRDSYTTGHQQRVARLSWAIAKEISLPEEQIEGIHMAAIIHDVGKINVPAEILSKPSRLMETELALIKVHSQAGYEIVKEIEFPWPIAEVILQHHERIDGSGYPQGFSGKDILIEAKILAVADVVEAMSSNRPYRPALGIDKALKEISQNRGILYDPKVVDACLKLFREKRFTFE